MAYKAKKRQDEAGGVVVVGADARVELISLVFRLAGNPEYSKCNIRRYDRAIIRHFGKFSEHAAVRMARKLREQRGVGFDAPMGLAIRLTGPPHWRLRVPFRRRSKEWDSRWTPARVRDFLRALRRFAKDTQFMDFYNSHGALYKAAARPVGEVIAKKLRMEWFEEFFGARPKAQFKVIVGLQNGGGNYGPRTKANGTEELYSILGVYRSSRAGVPKFDERVIFTAVHEFCHSFVNPLVESRLKELRPFGERLFGLVRSAMKRQAYGSWETMLIETLVRACVIRYCRKVYGNKTAAELILIEKRQNRFLAVEGLSRILSEYESERGGCPTLEVFFPRIVEFYKKLTRGKDRDPIFDLPEGYEPAYSQQLSPEGKYLAFGGLRWRDDAKPQAGLWVHNRKTGKVRRLIKGDLCTPPAWSPDGKMVAISTGEGYGGAHNLVMVEAGRGKKIDLKAAGAGPAFAPDGKTIAFSGGFAPAAAFWCGIPMSGSIYVRPAKARGRARRISPAGEGALCPVWSPDGKRVAYQVLAGGNELPRKGRRPTRPRFAEVFVVGSSGRGRRRVYRYRVMRNGMLYPMRWGESGKELLIEMPEGEERIAVD